MSEQPVETPPIDPSYLNPPVPPPPPDQDQLAVEKAEPPQP